MCGVGSRETRGWRSKGGEREKEGGRGRERKKEEEEAEEEKAFLGGWMGHEHVSRSAS